MTYEEWEASVHPRIKRESIWQFYGYRKALFLYDLAWADCDRLMKDRRGRAIADQLIRSAGSVCANLEEGHGRGYGKERDWFFNVALASARETKGWYWRARRLLPPEVLEHRLALVDEVIALIVTEQRQQQSRRPSQARASRR
ncbi:MAG: four helix bundle protein [Anaerolineae bacterium]|nr:four helix bundle protein [Anaerolineae bacterium]MDW7992735.1 four helix bundle protein [Anaerolineae bacterium]